MVEYTGRTVPVVEFPKQFWRRDASVLTEGESLPFCACVFNKSINKLTKREGEGGLNRHMYIQASGKAERM